MNDIEDLKAIGERVKQVRKDLDLLQNEMAKRTAYFLLSTAFLRS